jgi:hypothetical protein
MRSNSLTSNVFAFVMVAAAAAASAQSPLTYSVVSPAASQNTAAAPAAPQTIYTVAAPATTGGLAPQVAPAPVALTAKPELTTFPPSNEPLAPTAYAARFRANAFQALTQAANIEALTGRPALTAEELDLFQDASDGHANHWSMAEASLLISGVTDRNERQQYVAQIKQICEEAKAATAGANTVKAKARLLAKYLLKSPMHAGYLSGQFDMRKLLDTGKFNCVSSAVLFLITAHAVGIEAGAVQQPHHIFTRVPGFDVEPTSGGVYSADIRHDRILKDLVKDKLEVGDSYTQDRIYHETGDFGALNSIYYDTGCNQEEAKEYGAAVISNLKAACLDATDPNLGLHLDRDFSKWFKSALDNHNLPQAASIANLYRQISRDPQASNTMFQQLAATQHVATR